MHAQCECTSASNIFEWAWYVGSYTQLLFARLWNVVMTRFYIYKWKLEFLTCVGSLIWYRSREVKIAIGCIYFFPKDYTQGGPQIKL